MSHGTPAAAGERPIPVSRGMTLNMRWLFVLAVIVVFVMGSIVVVSSNFGRIWPSADSATVPLPTH